jgi:arylsulfatase A
VAEAALLDSPSASDVAVSFGTGTTPYGAVRSGDWKLIETYDDRRIELYDLRADVGEQKDLAAAQPARANDLRNRLHPWRESVGAQMPTKNPDYDPTAETDKQRLRRAERMV